MGFFELLIILLFVLLFFGAGKLGGLGAGLGKVKSKSGAPSPPRE